MSSRLRLSALLVAVGATVCQAASAASFTYANVNWSAGNTAGPNVQVDGGSDTSTTTASHTISASLGDSQFSGSAWANTTYGYAQGYAAVGLESVTTSQDHVEMSFVLEWSDSVTISDPLLNGSAGELTASILLDLAWGMDATAISNPLDVAQYLTDVGWNINIAADTSSVFSLSGERTSGGDSTGIFDWGNTPQPTGTYTFTVPFTFGVPFDLDVAIAGSAQAHTGPTQLVTPTAVSLSAFNNFSNTAQWQGISAVLDENGNPVSGYTVSSETGTNWSETIPAPVPVPAAAWLFASGAGCLAGMRGLATRRRQGGKS